MRWQTTAVVAVVLLALGAFYYVYEIKGGPARAKVEAQKGRLWTVDASDVTEVELKRTGEVVKLKREADGWQILEPVTARGDRAKVDETLTTLTTARVDREIESAPKRLDQYGLDTPAADITLRLKDGRQLGLQLGAKNPTGVWAYAREAGKPAVFVVSDMVLRDVTRPLVDFRDRTVLAFGQRQVTAFEVATREETLAVEQANDRWKLTRPVALPADAQAVTDFLDKLQSMRVKEFVAEAPKSLVPYGLERPIRVSIHTGRDKDRATKALLIGEMDRTKRGVYAMRPGESSVLLLPAEAWTIVPKNVAALRDKVVVEVDRDKVTRVDLESPRGTVTELRDRTLLPAFEPRDVRTMRVRAGGQTVVVERSGDAEWRMVEGGRGAAKGANVESLLYTLRALKWKAIAAPGGEDSVRYGLDSPVLEVTLLREGGAEIATVLVGKREGDHAYVKLRVLPAIYSVDTKALGELPKIPDDFKG